MKIHRPTDSYFLLPASCSTNTMKPAIIKLSERPWVWNQTVQTDRQITYFQSTRYIINSFYEILKLHKNYKYSIITSNCMYQKRNEYQWKTKNKMWYASCSMIMNEILSFIDSITHTIFWPMKVYFNFKSKDIFHFNLAPIFFTLFWFFRQPYFVRVLRRVRYMSNLESNIFVSEFKTVCMMW